MEIKFNLDRKSVIFTSIILVLLLIISLMLFGRDHDDDHHGHMGMNQSGQMMNTQDSTFSGSDTMFAQMMIPHHQQAIEMSDLALKISKNADVLKLAEQIKNAQTPEITQMKSWLTSAGASETMDHSMGMGGMLSDSEIHTLATSTGKKFDSLFLTGMISHHEGAIHMVTMIQDSANSEVKKLGEAIVESQTREIEVMQKILKGQ